MPLRMPEPTGFDTPGKSPTWFHFLTYQARPRGPKKQAPGLAGWGSTKSSPHLWWTKRAEDTLLGTTGGCLPELAIAKVRADASDPGHFLPQTAVAGGAPLPACPLRVDSRTPLAARGDGGGLEIDTTSFLSGVHVVPGRWIYVQRHRARRDPRRLCCRRQRRADPFLRARRRRGRSRGLLGTEGRELFRHGGPSGSGGGCLSLLMPDAWKVCSPVVALTGGRAIRRSSSTTEPPRWHGSPPRIMAGAQRGVPMLFISIAMRPSSTSRLTV
jgi:hypothetical protein